jgi:hypothetical protein
MAPVSFDIPYRTYQRCTSRKSKGILITYLFSTQSFAELLASWAARCIWVALSRLDMDTMIQFLVRCRPHLHYGCCGGIATGWTASICAVRPTALTGDSTNIPAYQICHKISARHGTWPTLLGVILSSRSGLLRRNRILALPNSASSINSSIIGQYPAH